MDVRPRKWLDKALRDTTSIEVDQCRDKMPIVPCEHGPTVVTSMPMFRERRQVRHGPAEMFALVADMERYPEFLPLCERNVVRSRSPRGDAEVVFSEMTVTYKFLRETFRSRVTLDKANRRILIDAEDGPLRELRIRWSFKPVDGGGCEVDFHLSYELPSRVLAGLVGSVLDSAFSRFVEAFERRANALCRAST
jgi:coenzyme Q-binding protein COQ10